MFDKVVTTSDDFLELSAEAQCLYFHMGMLADDDGLSKNYRSYMKLVGATNEDLQSLIDKSFIYKFTVNCFHIVFICRKCSFVTSRNQIRPFGYILYDYLSDFYGRTNRYFVYFGGNI